jgi:Uncharacterized membrane-associated protein
LTDLQKKIYISLLKEGHVQEFIEQWGYIAVFLGSLVEGESVIFMAGWMAQEGFLSLPKIIVVAFTGTLLADQSLFFMATFMVRSY